MTRQWKEGGERLAGAALAAASLLSVVVMAHHPSGAGSHGGLAQAVHGALMGLILVTFAGFARFAAGLGLQRYAATLGLTAYATGSLANLLAATMNGFVAPALATGGASQEVLRLCWELSQALAYAAVYAISAAFVCWGAELGLRGAGADRWLGAAGLAAGLAPAGLLASGALDMNVAGAFIVYGAQAAFGGLAGVFLTRGMGRL